MNRVTSAFLSVLAFVVAAIATPAFAQDYTLTNVSGQLQTVPASATKVTGLSDDNYVAATLPFAFPYFGGASTQIYIHSNGYLQVRPTNTPSVSYGTGCPPTIEGSISACQADLNPGVGGTVSSFTIGNAPNRIHVIAFTAVPHYSSGGPYTFQFQLYETTGRIVLAYETQSATWTNLTATIGIKAPAPDTRFSSPKTSGYYTTNPGTDFQFDPKPTVFTGRMLMNEIVSDATGFGNSVRANVPCTGLGLELRSATTGSTIGFGSVDGTGAFTLSGLALNPAQSGNIYASTSNSICRVSPSTSSSSQSAYSFLLRSNVSFAAAGDIGTTTLDDTNDPGGAFRQPAQIMSAIGRAYTWVRARSSKTLGTLEVYYSDTGSTEKTKYSAPSGPTAAYLRIGGSSSGNLDAYDTGIVMRGYARHLVRSITGATVPTSNLTLDVKTDEVTALADGLGGYLYAIIDGASSEYDSTSGTAATTFSYESPFLTTAKGPDVGGWFVPAMYDLIDASNESHDVIDGSLGLAAERPFSVLDSLTSLSMIDFVLAWQGRGYDGIGLVKNLVYHGVLRDDASEPDDTSASAFDLGTAGVLAKGRTLNPYNEDWYKINVPVATPAFIVEAVYNASTTTASVLLEIRSQAGAVLATGAYDSNVGAMRAFTGAIPAGPVLIRLVHQSGGHLGSYDLQAYGSFGATAAFIPEWTVGQAFAQPVTILGGIGPYTVTVKKAEPLPTGLVLDPVNPRIFGVPATPGTTIYSLNLTDSGAPQHTSSLTVTLQVNDVLSFTAPLLTGVAVGKNTDVSLGRAGGTNPVALSNRAGTIPEGLTLTPDFHITGVTTQVGGGDLSFTATDVAGSTTDVATTLVVCDKHPGGRLALDLGAGSSAAGFYFDAVAGSSASIDLATAKKRAARDFQVLLVGPDGAAVGGGLVKVKRGKASLKNVPLALSGRYFLVLKGTDQAVASQLLGGLKVVLPTKGSESNVFDFGEKLEFSFGALNGAQLTIQGTTTLGMQMRVDSLTRPDGTVVAPDAVTIQQAKGKFKITVTLDQSGTWDVVLAPQLGPVGAAKFTYTIKQPKNVAYSVD
ncbi:MAG: hypothetical protein K8T90_00960 [Planctomycetes bacterium]|nr:hypothetical protein [Planctomycetota bacterium]